MTSLIIPQTLCKNWGAIELHYYFNLFYKITMYHTVWVAMWQWLFVIKWSCNRRNILFSYHIDYRHECHGYSINWIWKGTNACRFWTLPTMLNFIENFCLRFSTVWGIIRVVKYEKISNKFRKMSVLVAIV